MKREWTKLEVYEHFSEKYLNPGQKKYLNRLLESARDEEREA